MTNWTMTNKCIFCLKDRNDNGKKLWDSNFTIDNGKSTFIVTVCRKCRYAKIPIGEIYRRIPELIKLKKEDWKPFKA